MNVSINITSIENYDSFCKFFSWYKPGFHSFHNDFCFRSIDHCRMNGKKWKPVNNYKMSINCILFLRKICQMVFFPIISQERCAEQINGFSVHCYDKSRLIFQEICKLIRHRERIKFVNQGMLVLTEFYACLPKFEKRGKAAHTLVV